jgi:hypothetical protein
VATATLPTASAVTHETYARIVDELLNEREQLALVGEPLYRWWGVATPAGRYVLDSRHLAAVALEALLSRT